MQTEAQILERIKVARGTAEPATAGPTETPEAVEVSTVDTEPAETEESVELAEQTQAEQETVEADESEELSETELPQDDDDEDLYVEYKGREINLKNIEEWEQGHLRQSDYTRKTQALSDERKQFEREKEAFTATQQKVNENLVKLEAMIKSDQLSSEELAEMREYEPEKYIEYTERQRERQKIADELKQEVKAQSVDTQAEQQKLLQAFPEWLDDGKPTQKYQEDMKALQKLYTDKGFDQSAADVIGSNAMVAKAIIEAARLHTKAKTNNVIAKKVRKVPVSTKPKQQVNNRQQDEIKALTERVKKLGRPEDFAKLRQLKRQAGN